MAHTGRPEESSFGPEDPSTQTTASLKMTECSLDPLPSPPETPNSKKKPISSSALYRYVSEADRSLVRLQRLLTTTAGLDTLLSTLNYALYILVSLESRVPSRPVIWRKLFGLPSQHPRTKSQESPSAHAFTSLAALVSETRITLRLTGLLPLCLSLRELLAGNKIQDRYLRGISLVQCLFYIVFQFTENVAHLTDKRIISEKWLAKRGGSAKWWMLSSRAWLAGVFCDLILLIRKASIERERRNVVVRAKGEEQADTEQTIDRLWWNQLFVTGCWLPLCLHYSLHKGLKGVDTGIVGLLGFVGGAQSFAAQWAKTEERDAS